RHRPPCLCDVRITETRILARPGPTVKDGPSPYRVAMLVADASAGGLGRTRYDRVRGRRAASRRRVGAAHAPRPLTALERDAHRPKKSLRGQTSGRNTGSSL